MRIRSPHKSFLDYAGEGHEEYIFKCPGGCGEHRVIVKQGKGRSGPEWSWNGSMESPTFSPSLLVQWEFSKEEHGLSEKHICHSFIREGKIEFLSDCTHKLSGQTVELQEIL